MKRINLIIALLFAAVAFAQPDVNDLPTPTFVLPLNNGTGGTLGIYSQMYRDALLIARTGSVSDEITDITMMSDEIVPHWRYPDGALLEIDTSTYGSAEILEQDTNWSNAYSELVVGSLYFLTPTGYPVQEGVYLNNSGDTESGLYLNNDNGGAQGLYFVQGGSGMGSFDDAQEISFVNYYGGQMCICIWGGATGGIYLETGMSFFLEDSTQGAYFETSLFYVEFANAPMDDTYLVGVCWDSSTNQVYAGSNCPSGGGGGGGTITLSGDASGSGTSSITVTNTGMNGAAVPSSATITGTNSSGQIVAAALMDTYVFIGNGSNLPVGVALSQDASVTDTGVWTNTGINAAAVPASATVAGTNSSSQIIAAALTQYYVWVGNSSSLPAGLSIPDCQDSGGNHLNFTRSTPAFSCGTSSSGGGGTITLSGDVSGSGTTSISVDVTELHSNTLTSGDWCSTDGTIINCAVTPITNTNQLTNGAGFLTANQTITLSGDASGSGTTSISVDVTELHSNTLTNGDWCTSDGTIINCNTGAPVTSVSGNNGLTGTVTTTGNIGLASVSTNVVLCNNTGSSAVPTGGNCTVVGTGDVVLQTNPTIIGPLISSALPSATSGDLSLGGSSTGGGLISGEGSTYDITVENYSGGTVCTVATGTTNWNCTGLEVGGTAVLTANQTITLSGDATGSGTTAITVDVIELHSNTITSGDWCTSNGTIINCNTGAPVTSIATNNGLTGGTITTTGTVGLASIANNAALCNNSGASAVPTSADCTVTGTGNLVLATGPTLSAPLIGGTPSSSSGYLSLGGSATNGGEIQGDGSTYDLLVANYSGAGVCDISHGSTTWNCAQISVNGTDVASAATSPITLTSGTVACSTCLTTSSTVTLARGFGAVFDGGGTALTAGSTAIVQTAVPYACTISAWTVMVDTGTATVDIWVNTGTTEPTSSNSITASALPAIASGTSTGKDTTLTGWTTSISAFANIIINLNAVSSATKVTLMVECDQTVTL